MVSGGYGTDGGCRGRGVYIRTCVHVRVYVCVCMCVHTSVGERPNNDGHRDGN